MISANDRSVRRACGVRLVCESVRSIDIRELHRNKLLAPGLRSSWGWSRIGKTSGAVIIEAEPDTVVFVYSTRCPGATKWRDVRQRVSLAWTSCAFGGRRPWFTCGCGRRVAILYVVGELFECRHCCGLAYASQRESPQARAIIRAQKARMQLGGNPSCFEPLPGKPRGMHWRTYGRLLGKALAMQGEMVDQFWRR